MILIPYYQRWQKAEHQVLFIALLYLVSSGCFVCTSLSKVRSWSFTVAFLVVTVLMMIALAVWYKQRKGLVTKVFYVGPQAAAQIVDSVLYQKGIPFDRVNQWTIHKLQVASKVVFNVQGEQLTIYVREVWNRFSRGVRIEIGPVTDENRTLVRSLQDKIDDAFTPKGL